MIEEMQVVRTYGFKALLFPLSLALLIAVVALAASDGDSATKQRRVIPGEPNAAARTYALLAGIPQHGSVLGDPRAPVTLQFFGDLQCGDSRQVMLGALPFLIRHWVRDGKLQIRFRSTETDTQGAGGWFEFREQQGAAMAAGAQGKLWNFIDVFYRDQGPEFTGYVDDDFLERIADQAGLERQAWDEARTPPEAWVPQIETDEALASAAGVESTPSFLVGPTGGPAHALLHFSLDEPAVFDEAIEAVLRKP